MPPKPRVAETAAPFKLDGEYCRFVRLTRGLVCIVSESDYDFISQWTWTAHRNTSTGEFYAERHGSISMHRTILGLQRGDGLIADHKNGNILDNRRSNLRVVTPQQSAMNRSFKGVHHKSPNSWQARITRDGVNVHLGSFPNEQLAINARRRAESEIFGEYARR